MPFSDPEGPMATRQDSRLVRTDDHWLHLPNPWGVPVDICAAAGVPRGASAKGGEEELVAEPVVELRPLLTVKG